MEGGGGKPPRPPVNLSMVRVRVMTHDSGSGGALMILCAKNNGLHPVATKHYLQKYDFMESRI